MEFEDDFATVDLLLSSNFETRGVDAFILSLIKAEKQLRRIFTFLVYQNPTFGIQQYSDLRKTLAANKKIYFTQFIDGINFILPKKLKTIYGNDYDSDLALFIQFTNDRNKIFHGQITSLGLSREDLLFNVDKIKCWCKILGEKMLQEIGFSGFGASYFKSQLDLNLRNLEKLDTISKYEAFLISIQRK